MPASHPDPPSSSLERLRTRAKQLTRAIRRADPDALAWVRRHLPGLARQADAAIAASAALADVQQGLARERGFSNWAVLVRAETSAAPLLAVVRAGDLPASVALAHRFRLFAETSAHAAAALGHVDALRRHLDDDATLVGTAHDGWPLLAYVCASPLHRLSGRHSAGLLECATLLVDRGADVNATVASDDAPGSLATPVAWLAMRTNNVAVMMLLRRRGADERALQPHAMRLFQWQPPWSHTIAEFHARPDVQDALKARIARWQRSDPRRRGHFTPIDFREFHDVAFSDAAPWRSDVPPWALPPIDRHSPDALLVGIAYTFPRDLIDLLLARGFDCRAPRLVGRSLVAVATRAGRREIAALLRAHGAPDDDVTPMDEVMGACMRLDADDARAVLRAHPNALAQLTPADINLLTAAARAGAIDHVRVLLDAGLPADAPGTAGITPLHGAAWHGHADVVRLLLERGAALDVRDGTYDDTPRGWAAHGRLHCRTAEDDYREVLRRLGAR